MNISFDKNDDAKKTLCMKRFVTIGTIKNGIRSLAFCNDSQSYEEWRKKRNFIRENKSVLEGKSLEEVQNALEDLKKCLIFMIL